MAKPASLDICIIQGSTFRLKLTWTDDTNFPNPGNPIDITGYTARMMIRNEVGDVSPLIELTTENGRITLGGANGEIDLFIDDADTEALDYEEGVYDLELETAGVGLGDVTRIVEGKAPLSLEVTR